MEGVDGRIVGNSRRQEDQLMPQDLELSPYQATLTSAERERLARYAQKRIQEIRDGVDFTTGLFWTMEEFQAMADEPPVLSDFFRPPGAVSHPSAIVDLEGLLCPAWKEVIGQMELAGVERSGRSYRRSQSSKGERTDVAGSGTQRRPSNLHGGRARTACSLRREADPGDSGWCRFHHRTFLDHGRAPGDGR